MYRATTPLHTFVFDINPASFKTILITYAQDDRIILEKNKDDLTIVQGTDGGKTVYEASLRLSQEESKMFNSCGSVKVQIRALTYEDEALASAKMTVNVRSVLNDEVLT